MLSGYTQAECPYEPSWRYYTLTALFLQTHADLRQRKDNERGLFFVISSVPLLWYHSFRFNQKLNLCIYNLYA